MVLLLSQRVARNSEKQIVIKKPIVIIKKPKPISKENLNYPVKKSVRRIYTRLRR